MVAAHQGPDHDPVKKRTLTLPLEIMNVGTMLGCPDFLDYADVHHQTWLFSHQGSQNGRSPIDKAESEYANYKELHSCGDEGPHSPHGT